METAATSEQMPQSQAGKKEKRFQCPHCQRLFARLEHLQRHERIRKSNHQHWTLPLTDFKTVVLNLSVVLNAITRSLAGMHILLHLEGVSLLIK